MSQFMNPVPTLQGALAPQEGDVTLSEAASARRAVARLLASNRSPRLLIDATAIRSVPKPSHLFDFVKWLACSFPRAARVALVVRPDQVRHARLIERVARKAGAFLTYFTDRQRAERWVRGPTFPRTYLSSPGSGHPAVTTTVTALMKEPYVE